VTPRAISFAFVAVGVANAAVGLVMLVAPRWFYESIATFQPRNDHFIRDYATIHVALGVALVAAARRPAWRGAVLLVAVLQFALHTANHVYDLGYPEEGWVGPVTTGLLAASLAVLIAVALLAARPRRADFSRARVTE
jgi:hypothetical protein